MSLDKPVWLSSRFSAVESLQELRMRPFAPQLRHNVEFSTEMVDFHIYIVEMTNISAGEHKIHSQKKLSYG
jgi:hypothetical protein